MLIFGTLEGYKAITNTSSLTSSDYWDSLFKVRVDYLLNFNSLVENVPRLDALNPYWNTNSNQIFTDELSFDTWYVNHITTSPEAFKQIVDIMRAVYNGKNVYILCDWSNEIGVNMIEALIKFITDNYGYRCNIVNNPNYIYVKDGTFSSEGIQLLDANMETYIKMFGVRELPSDHGDLA